MDEKKQALKAAKKAYKKAKRKAIQPWKAIAIFSIPGFLSEAGKGG